MMMEIGQLRDENKKIVNQLKMEEEKKLHDLREKTLLEHSEMQSRFDNEKRNYMS